MTKEGDNARRVTFPRHRPGLSKRAREVCTVCAVEMAIVVLSPGGQPFYSGQPSADAVRDGFAHPKMARIDAPQKAQTDRDQFLENLNRQYADVLKQLKAGMKGAEEMDDMKPLPFQNFSFDDFIAFDKWLEDLEKAVDKRRMELLALEASSSTPSPRVVNAPVGSQNDDERGDPRKAEAGHE